VRAHRTGGVRTVHAGVHAHDPGVLERNEREENAVISVIINKIHDMSDGMQTLTW
jgi:hypothetical protein